MSVLNNLKLVTSKKHQTVAPIVNRRNKLCARLHEQIQLCESQKIGQTFAPKRMRTFVNKETGLKTSVEVTKRVKAWFYVSGNKIHLSIKYGAKTLPLNKKGMNAVEVNDGDELIETLKALKVAVLNGELDDAINDISETTRSRFLKQ